MSNEKIYDVLIIGAGPAGLTASIYASRYQLKNLVIGKLVGGEMALSSEIENYPGFKSIQGIELSQKMKEQIESLGSEILLENVVKVQKLKRKNGFEVIVEGGKKYSSSGLIIASGTERRKLNIPGEKEYVGKGVSYCETCDGIFFKDKVVSVIGAGDSAVKAAVMLADIAKKVYLIYRKKKEDMRAKPIWIERLDQKVKDDKAELILETNLTEIVGDNQKVTGITLDKKERSLKLDGVFILIGSVPVTDLLVPLGVETDESGYIKINQECATNIEGVYGAGDITTGSNGLQQIVTAAAEGAIAASSLYHWLKKKEAPKLWG